MGSKKLFDGDKGVGRGHQAIVHIMMYMKYIFYYYSLGLCSPAHLFFDPVKNKFYTLSLIKLASM